MTINIIPYKGGELLFICKIPENKDFTRKQEVSFDTTSICDGGKTMEERGGLIATENSSLLDIFSNEDDRKGTDLLQMSNYFDVFIGKISEEVDTNGNWEIVEETKNLLGQIAAAIKGGFDISKMGTLVADTSHFSKDIVDRLKEGIYHIGESKEVAGHLRPAILDENEKLVKFMTLKKAINPTDVLSDISTLSMQTSLKNITAQIESVGRDVKGISTFVRRESLSNKFIYARDKIMLAATADGEQRERYLIEADTYLMEGLTALYADVNAEVANLSNLKGPFRSLKAVDEILTHINEDMQMIPRYVGLRVYLLNLRHHDADTNRVLGEYRYQLENLSDRKIDGGKYTALEMIHRYYPYNEENVNFWLEQPKQMLEVLHSYENMIEQKNSDVFYINSESEVCDNEQE